MPNTRYEDNFFTEFTTYSKHVEGSPSNHTGSIASEFGIRTSRKTVQSWWRSFCLICNLILIDYWNE